jgi:hypothetical protein
MYSKIIAGFVEIIIKKERVNGRREIRKTDTVCKGD